MAGKPSDDKPKVMDVSKPGKGKIIINSRPIAAPVVKEKAESTDVMTPAADASETAPLLAPSAAKKVIQPISVVDDSDDDSKVEVKQPVAAAAAVVPEASAEPEAAPKEPAAPEAVQPEPEETPAEPAEPETEETTAQDVPETTDNLPTPKADDSPIAPANDDSGAASVDELAKAAEQKRLAAEKSKEDTEREKHVDELIKSKKYNVPIKHSAGSSKAKWLFATLALLLFASAAYLTVDMGVFGDSIKVPYEFIKSESLASDKASASETYEDEASVKKEETTSATPINKAQDEDRKSELKNLQQSLETHFNDNGEYPQTLAGLTPAPSTEALTDDDGNAYGYVTNGRSYTLSATLENKQDPDADEDGDYVLNSVNQ